VPLKLFEYLACGETGHFLDFLEWVVSVGERIFYADTSTEITNRLNNILDTGISEEQCKENRSLVCEKYSWNNTAQHIEESLVRLG
jgi:hypothetical protein